MSLLEATINAGSAAGQRVRVNRSPAPFGRDADNALVIDLPTVSRVHGELRYDEGRWYVVNLSPNGTILNRRPVGRRPRPLSDNDQIVVGDQPVMTVAVREEGQDAPVIDESHDIGPAPALAPSAGMSPRTKLWLSIIGFWALIFTLAFIFVGLEDTQDRSNQPTLPPLSDKQIEDAIRAPLPAEEPIPRIAIDKFEDAESAYQMINADPINVFRAYYAYKTALSYAFGDDFTDDRDDWGGKPEDELGLAQKRMLELENRLIADLQRLYKDAYGKLRDRRYREAYDAFKRVMDLYADPQNPVYRNAVRQRDLARRRMEQR